MKSTGNSTKPRSRKDHPVDGVGGVFLHQVLSAADKAGIGEPRPERENHADRMHNAFGVSGQGQK